MPLEIKGVCWSVRPCEVTPLKCTADQRTASKCHGELKPPPHYTNKEMINEKPYILSIWDCWQVFIRPSGLTSLEDFQQQKQSLAQQISHQHHSGLALWWRLVAGIVVPRCIHLEEGTQRRHSDPSLPKTGIAGISQGTDPPSPTLLALTYPQKPLQMCPCPARVTGWEKEQGVWGETEGSQKQVYA